MLVPTLGSVREIRVLIPISEVREINKIVDFRERVYAAALMYARSGIAVVPLRPKTKILPPKATGLNYSSASTKTKTIKRWFGPSGSWRGSNIGIVCGRSGGVFAIDLDKHGRKDGVAKWEELVAPFGELVCPIQSTPTGGRHLLVNWKENLASSSGKLGPGIDTRGGDGIGRSHIVAWPSVTEDGTYEWYEGGEIPDAPGWVVDSLGVPWTSGATRGNQNVGEDDVEFKHSLIAIQAMLDHIEVNDLSYEEWLWIGQAIHSQYPGTEGLKMWDGWSGAGDRYILGECQRRWPGFNQAGPIRMGTLVYYAKKGGFDPRTDPAIRAGSFDELVERMNKHNAVILVGGKVRIAHRDKLGNIHIMGTSDFNSLMYNKKTTLHTGKVATEADIWMAEEGRRECLSGLGFFPNEPLWHKDYVNIWQGWGVESIKGDWSRLQDHILNVLCEGKEELNRYVLDWVADMIQDPMNPKGTAIVMHGKEGTGKGTFAQVIGRLIGKKHYKHVTNEKHLTGNFNYLLMDGLLIFADEVVYGGSRQTAGILKSMVTERELVCERKGIDAFMYANRARIVVASNEDWYIGAGPESRRWLVLEVNDAKSNDAEYFDGLFNQMECGGYEAMMYDLVNRKITSNLSHALVTRGLVHQRAIYRSTGDSVDIWVDHCAGLGDLGCYDTNTEGGWPEDVDRMELYRAYDTWAMGKKGLRSKGTAHFYRKVEDYGFTKHRPKSKGDVRRWRYRVPPLSQFNTES